MSQRATQFAPFAALTGHSAAVEETARKTREEMNRDIEHIPVSRDPDSEC